MIPMVSVRAGLPTIFSVVLLLLASVFGRAVAAAPESSVTLLAQGGTIFHTPLDATPDPEGALVYFVARTLSGEGAVFAVPSSGGPVESVQVGDPLVAPRGLVLSTDGRTLYVADPEAEAGGAVFALPVDGGPASPVLGTRGMRPRALDLVQEGEGDVLYVAGLDAETQRAALWRLPLGPDGAPTPLLRGYPLALADGVVAASSGKIYVAGRSGQAERTDRVLEVNRGSARPLVRAIRLGSPAGIALSLDESQLLVSSLAADGTSQVLILDLLSGSTSIFNEGIGANRASGGLHRAHRADYFAWADAGPPGRVYGVQR